MGFKFPLVKKPQSTFLLWKQVLKLRWIWKFENKKRLKNQTSSSKLLQELKLAILKIKWEPVCNTKVCLLYMGLLKLDLNGGLFISLSPYKVKEETSWSSLCIFNFSYYNNLSSMLLHTNSDDQLYIYVNVKFQINLHFMDMKRHMLICLFISMLVDRKKEWDGYGIWKCFI